MRFKTHAILAAAIGGVCSLTLLTTPAPALQTRPATTARATTTTAPASTMPADAVPLVATITSVKGGVEVRAGEGQPWQKAQVGMKIDQGTEIRTGLRSAVQFVVGDDQTITLDRLGTVTVLQAFESRGKAKTDLGLKYGRTRYDIKKTDLEHESTIRSPGSTLAIRGTDVIYEDQAPWVPRAISREGRAEFRNYRRQFLAFGGTKRAAVAADKNSTAEQAVSTTKNDPKGAFAGRTTEEDELNLTLQTLGGPDALGLQALQAQKAAFGGEVISGTVDVPGPLTFVLGFLAPAGGATPVQANVDLFVTDPRGEVASAMNPVIGTGSAIGQHSGDDPGLGESGFEQVVWGAFFPSGGYVVTATHQGGLDARITIEATQGADATRIGSFGIDPDPPIILSAGESFTGTVTAPGATSTRASARAAARAAVRAERADRRSAMQRAGR